MSHFSLGVITREKPDEAILEEKLEPFGQHIRVRTVTPKADIIERARKQIENYEKHGAYADYLKDPEEYKKDSSEHHIEYLEETFPKLLEMNDEELYQYEIRFEDVDNITRDGDIISYFNPHTKWDWWVLGGRWANGIPTKFNENVNIAKISDIDYTPDEEYAKELSNVWDAQVEGKDVEYKSFFPPTKEFLLGVYGTKENYIQTAAEFSTYALLLPSGEWVEPGRMGYFGISDKDVESTLKYIKDRREIMDEFSDYYLSIVDCHI